MPRRLRTLSGDDVIGILERHGFVVRSSRGSHVKLQRTLDDDTRQTLTLPRHDELDKGTLKAIFRQAARYLTEAELLPDFYSE